MQVNTLASSTAARRFDDEGRHARPRATANALGSARQLRQGLAALLRGQDQDGHPLVHSEADVNPDTTPLQSHRLYEAIRGTGGTVRLVMLPFESHGYQARESIEHTLYEQLSWFDRSVKSAAPHEQKLTSAPGN